MPGTIPNPLRTNVNKADMFPALMELEGSATILFLKI